MLPPLRQTDPGDHEDDRTRTQPRHHGKHRARARGDPPHTVGLAPLATMLASFGLVVISGVQAPANAVTLGYPWASAKCEWTENAGGSCTNYDWYWDENGDGHFTGTNCDSGGASSECFDQWGYQYRNCTSYLAWRLAQNGYSMPAIGNANNWDNYFAGKVPVNGTPAVGAIAQTDAGSFGHVAYVESYTDSTVTISEYNHDLLGNGDTRTVPIGTFQYIHVHDLPTQQGPHRALQHRRR